MVLIGYFWKGAVNNFKARMVCLGYHFEPRLLPGVVIRIHQTRLAGKGRERWCNYQRGEKPIPQYLHSVTRWQIAVGVGGKNVAKRGVLSDGERKRKSLQPHL
jgi:hypothetical protein